MMMEYDFLYYLFILFMSGNNVNLVFIVNVFLVLCEIILMVFLMQVEYIRNKIFIFIKGNNI